MFVTTYNSKLNIESFKMVLAEEGTGPSISVQQSRETAQLNNRARVLGQELIRDDISDSDIVRTENEVKDTNPHDKHNASVRVGHVELKANGMVDIGPREVKYF